MNLCGAQEAGVKIVLSPIREPVQSRPLPPSPLNLSMSHSEMHTPRSMPRKAEAFIAATPSPSLLNPLTHDFWSESASPHSLFCPILETSNNRQASESYLQSGDGVVSFIRQHGMAVLLALRYLIAVHCN